MIFNQTSGHYDEAIPIRKMTIQVDSESSLHKPYLKVLVRQRSLVAIVTITTVNEVRRGGRMSENTVHIQWETKSQQ